MFHRSSAVLVSRLAGISFMLAITIQAAMSVEPKTAEAKAAAVARVGEDIRYLASDELEGRGVDTKGIHLAADRILEEYRRHGLKPGMPDGTFKQAFEVATGETSITSETDVVLTDPEGKVRRLEVGKEFQPLRRGMNGRGTGELVFVGYGITSREDNYDDFADIDVAGKVLVMVRREPQQGMADGAFQGTATSSHAYIDSKLQLASEHKAAGILFVNDPFSVTDAKSDELTPPAGFGTSEAGVPFAHVLQSVIDDLLMTTPLKVRHDGEVLTLSSLKAAGDFIDAHLKPVSQPLNGWSAEVRTHFDTQSVTAYNLIGVLEGEGPLADETIIIGGHYDHLGYGGYGSRAKNREGEIHNGADDNATGTAAVLELVRRAAAGPKPPRRIVFICFSGEERGLLGSAWYVKNPVFPLEKTITMLNFDMIGTLRNNNVEVNGVATAKEFADIVKAADEESELNVRIVENPFGGSDHLPFFRKKIPVMFCFTGVTPRYHTPDDDFEMINVEGVVAVVDLSERIMQNIVQLPAPPEFQEVSRSRRPVSKVPYLGVVPNLGADGGEAGIPIQGVRPDSPAKQAGIQVGDVIIKANDDSIDGYSDLIKFIRQSKAGDEVLLTVMRGTKQVQLKATLAPPK